VTRAVLARPSEHMKNLENPKWMFVKAALLFGIGMLSATLLVIRDPRVSTAVLLALVIWAFSRVYYFAFYVIERYIDPSFRFSGLFSAAKYAVRKR
jgi:uncharacterized membrane-anchored protein